MKNSKLTKKFRYYIVTLLMAGCTQQASLPTQTPQATALPTQPPTATALPTATTVPTPTTLPQSELSDTELLWVTDGGENAFLRPTELTLDSQGNIYIIDGGNHRVQKFDQDGNFILSWGQRGIGEGEFIFQMPPAHYGNLTADIEDNIYVTDRNNRVQKFDANGQFIMQFGETGYGEGEFIDLYGIAVDETGNIYTGDWTKANIQKFDPNGIFLLEWSVPPCQLGGVSMPHGLAINSQGNLYVTNASGACIQLFDPQGKLLQQWGERGKADGQLGRPMGIAVDAEGNVWVTENSNGRIQKFDANGKFLSYYGTYEYPVGLAIDTSGNLYVVEIVKAILTKFQPK